MDIGRASGKWSQLSLNSMKAFLSIPCALSSAILLVDCANAEPASGDVSDVGFPVIPAIADANPAERYPISVRVPSRLQVARSGDSLTVAVADFQTVKLTLGHNMVTGMQCEKRIHNGSALLPLGTTLQSGFIFEPLKEVFTREGDKVPGRDEKYSVEYKITMFETDVPSQHMWLPQGGKHYKVLWSHTFKEMVK